MKYILLLLIIIVFPLIANAQFKPSEQQELSKHNAIVNGGFENGKKAWALGTGNTLAFGSTELLNQHGSVSVSGNILDISNFTTKLAEFPNMAAMARCKINTSVSGINFQLLNNSGVVSELSVIGDGTWRDYQIPMVTDATLNAVKVVSDTSTVATVLIDDCYIELGPTTQFIPDSITDWKDSGVLLLTSDGTNPTKGATTSDKTYTRRAGDTLEMSIDFQQSGAGVAGTSNYLIGLPDGLNIDLNKVGSSSSTIVGTVGYGIIKATGGIEMPFQVTTYPPDANKMVVQVQNNSGANMQYSFSAWSAGTLPLTDPALGITAQIRVPIVGWSSGNSTITSQDTELTAETANEFDLTILSSASPTFTGDDYGIISTCVESNGTYNTMRCSYNADIFTVIPKVSSLVPTVNGSLAFNHACTVTAETLTYFDFNCKIANTSAAVYDVVNVTIDKKGADVNKSATIVGKFENINDTSAIQISARGSVGVSASPTVPYVFTEVRDDENLFDGSTFTPNRDGRYSMAGMTFLSTQTDSAVNLFVNDGGGYVSYSRCGRGNYSTEPFNCVIDAVAGYSYQLRPSNPKVQVASDTLNWLMITEAPDLTAVVKNLATDSKIECQTKYLQADSSSTGILTDLTFDTMEIGNKFTYKLHARTNAGQVLQVAHNGSFGEIYQGDSGDRSNSFDSGVFTATATTITVSNFSATNTYGSGSRTETFAELCELSGNYVTTEKF